jgi:ribonucleoside-diphosphate reductase beta chain
MKGMGQIVTWSIKDESIHCEGMLHLFRTLVEENPSVWTDKLKKEIYEAGRRMVELEDNFIDLAFSLGDVEGLDKKEIKEYIRYIADKRLLQMGLKPNFGVKDNPLPWLEEMLNSQEHANFFETRVTEYQKAAIKGNWTQDIWTKEINRSK